MSVKEYADEGWDELSDIEPSSEGESEDTEKGLNFLERDVDTNII